MMQKFRLNIESKNTKPSWFPYSKDRIIHWGISLLLLFVTTFFITSQVIPLLHKLSLIEDTIQKQQQVLGETNKELNQIKLAGPFQRRWHPRYFVRFAELCTNDTSVYQRFVESNMKNQIHIEKVEVKPEKSRDMGYNYFIELIGKYPDIVYYLENLENAFSFFQIKEVKICPETAEKRYRGLIRLSISGWLW